MVIELAPNPLFQSILKRTVGGGVTVFSLMKAGQADNVEYFLNQMGQAYVQGMDMCPLKLCRPVQFPVPKSTPHVSPIVDKIWDHSVSWFVPNGELDRRKMRGNERAFDLDFTKRENEYIKDHIINGRTMCAAAGFLVIAWKTMASLRWTVFEEMNVVIKDVVFLRQRFLEPSDNDVSFKCRVQTNGIFEISENDVPLVRGSVFFPDEEEGGEGGERLVSIDVPEQDLTRQTVLSADEIRRSMRVHGWENKGEFDAILRANWDYTQADILWDGNWTPHIENILQCITQSKGLNSYSDIVSIGRIQIEPLEHWEASATTDEGEVHRMKHDQVTDTTVTGNIVIQNVEVKAKELPVAHEPFLAEKSEYVRFKAELKPSEEVQGYTSDCLEYTVAGLSKLVVEDRKSGNLPNRDDVVSVVSKRKCQVSIDGQLKKYAEKPNHGMAKFLQKIFQLHVTADFSKQVSELKENFQEELQDDDLLSILSSNNNLHPALQIVVDNTRIPNKAAMLEVDGTKSKLFENITEKVKRFPQLDASYTLSDSVDAKDLEKSHNLRYLNWSLSSPVEEDPEDKFDLVILKNVLHRQADLAKAWERVAAMLEVGGFVLVQEITQNFPIGATFELLGGNYPVCKDRRDNGRFLTESSWLSFFKSMGFESVYQRSDGALSTLFLLRKPKTDPGLTLFVNTTNPNTSWLSEVQSKYKQVVESKDENARLWIYADTFITGAPGFLRSLRQESSSQPSRVRCIVKGNVDPTSKLVKITPGSEEFKALSRLDLCVSEYRDGHWGFVAATPIPTDPKSQAVPSGRAYLHVDNPGENASFHYLQLQATPKSDNWAAVYYAAVNDVDVAMATGQTGAGGMASENFRGQSGLGVEFVGRDKNGRRLMGCGKQRMIATEVDLRETVHVPIPDKMSMREAAAVFVSYGTALYALVVKAKVHRGQSVLIHNGTGSIGQELMWCSAPCQETDVWPV
ncbi:fatty acid synthase [Aplysia californica]|uniref:Fatty acid synthase n=1 Tax=Aplysia californica TaxID=6500 RepID=A0ABM0ZVT3_APLCA|nr:fatty acid synthase [Aplysia californica]